jgi:hypothetical protein
VPLSTVVLGGYAPNSGGSNQRETSTSTQQIQPSSSQSATPSSTGIFNVESVRQMMASGESNDIITVNDGSIYITRKIQKT